MTKEDMILERLERIENQIAPMVQTVRSMQEAKDAVAAEIEKTLG